VLKRFSIIESEGFPKGIRMRECSRIDSVWLAGDAEGLLASPNRPTKEEKMFRQCAAKSLPRRASGRPSLAVIISALLVSPIVALGQASTVEVRWRNAERAKDMQV
jgi:hypothetical protein